MIWFCLYEAPKVVKLLETESTVVATGAKGKEGSKFLFCKMKRVLWMDSGVTIQRMTT
jgi:hypothetical protein